MASAVAAGSVACYLESKARAYALGRGCVCWNAVAWWYFISGGAFSNGGLGVAVGMA